MTICTNYYEIEFCLPVKNTSEDDWQKMKIPFQNLKQVEKKMTFFRAEFPGRKWRIWHVEKKETLHLEIAE